MKSLNLRNMIIKLLNTVYCKVITKVFLAFFGLTVTLVLCNIGLRTGVKSDAQPADPKIMAEYNRIREPIIYTGNVTDFWQDVDYSLGEKAPWWPKGESPLLSQLTKEGKLPSVLDRIGPEPAVYKGFGGEGNYGGDWWRMVGSIDRVRLSLQYELNGSTLVRYSPYGDSIRPQLAKLVEHSSDFKIWTVHLRRGVKWSDGIPFTAEDIYWWYKMVKLDPDVGAIDETLKVNGKVGYIEKVDDYTLRYIFPEPNTNWLSIQAGPSAAVYMCGPKHYMQQFHPKEGRQELIEKLCKNQAIQPKQLFRNMNLIFNPDRPTLSPWMFRTYRNNGPWTAVRNPYYYAVDEKGNQLPYIDRLIFQPISAQLQPKAITDGVCSFFVNDKNFMNENSSDYGSIISQQENGNYNVAYWTKHDRGRLVIIPNRHLPVKEGDTIAAQKRELLRNKNFRKALSISVNREAIIRSEFKGVGVASALMPTEGVPWFDEEYQKDNAQFDVQRANSIFDSLGLIVRDNDGYRTLPDGARLTLYMIARPGETAPLQFIVDDWQKVGLRVILKEKPHRLFITSEAEADLKYSDTSEGELSWKALEAGAPYWRWYYKGGMYGSEDSKSEINQPDHIEIEAMKAGQAALGTFDAEERFLHARKVMALARENVWAINIGTPEAAVVLVKNGLHGVPSTLKYSFILNSPYNACPETWYWENPETLNGAKASQEYLKERHDSIISELCSTTKNSEGEDREPSKSMSTSLGSVMRWCVLGIFIIGLILIILRHPYVLKRITIMIPTLFIISIIVFTGVQLPPGNYLSTSIDHLERNFQKEQVQQEIEVLTTMYHLDDGIIKSYMRWTGLLWFTSFAEDDTGILQGNLGRSMSNNGAFVSDLLGDRLVLTVLLSLGTILLTWIIAIPIGVYSAVRQYSIADYVLTVGGFLGMCIPQFILALVLMLLAKEIFGLSLMGLFSNQYAMQENWDLPKVIDLLQHLWLPVIIVGLGGTAGMIRVMRANLLDELKKPYVTTARAKGVRPLKLLLKYPFRIALNPFVSGIGGLFPVLISGSAIVSIILSLPTIGPLLLESVMIEDTYMAGSLLLILSAFSVFGVLVSDLLLMLLDPRIRMEGGSR